MGMAARRRDEAPNHIDASSFPWPEIGSDVVFVDIETSGGTRDVSRIIEIGLVRVASSGEIRRFESLFDPEGPVTTTFVHGLTNPDLEGAPTFAALWPRLAPWFADALVIAHKADFERAHLSRELDRIGGAFGARMLCTLKMARRLHPDRTGRGAHSLAGLQALYGLEPSGHAALADAESLAVLFTRWCAAEDEVPAGVRELVEEPDAAWQWPEVQGEGAKPRPRREPSAPVPRRGVGLGWVVVALALVITLVVWAILTLR